MFMVTRHLIHKQNSLLFMVLCCKILHNGLFEYHINKSNDRW